MFGYEFDITISPSSYDELNKLKNKLQFDESCYEELDGCDDAYDFCSFNIYIVEISGLTVSGSIAFLVANGYLSWLSNGTVDRVDEWVVYIDDEEPLRVGAINKFIQLIARRMKYADTELRNIIPKLEADWMNKDRQFVDGIISEIENLPDLGKVSKLLTGKL